MLFESTLHSCYSNRLFIHVTRIDSSFMLLESTLHSCSNRLQLTKREGDSSLMQLKEEYYSYDALRREHDTQIVSIAMEAGLRISPDQWSSLLYGDTNHKSHMQSIIDRLQTPNSFTQSVQELMVAAQRTNDPSQLITLKDHFEQLGRINASATLGEL